MPARTVPLITGEIYHIFNRGINRSPTFTLQSHYIRACLCLWYYRYAEVPGKLSHLARLPLEQQIDVRNDIQSRDKLVNIFAYCMMGNHFHLLLRQERDGGIQKSVGNFQNSYSKYFNSRTKRSGPLFGSRFHAVRVETEEQLIHLSRYIHLNPYSAYMISDIHDVYSYPWSSLHEYFSQTTKNPYVIADTELLSKIIGSTSSFREFIENHSGYQRELENIKHLLIED